MSTMNISLPDSLKAFVDEQASERGYGTSSEYVRELIRREQDRLQLRSLLLAGCASSPTTAVNDAYFEGLRAGAQGSQGIPEGVSAKPVIPHDQAERDVGDAIAYYRTRTPDRQR